MIEQYSYKQRKIQNIAGSMAFVSILKQRSFYEKKFDNFQVVSYLSGPVSNFVQPEISLLLHVCCMSVNKVPLSTYSFVMLNVDEFNGFNLCEYEFLIHERHFNSKTIKSNWLMISSFYFL